MAVHRLRHRMLRNLHYANKCLFPQMHHLFRLAPRSLCTLMSIHSTTFGQSTSSNVRWNIPRQISFEIMKYIEFKFQKNKKYLKLTNFHFLQQIFDIIIYIKLSSFCQFCDFCAVNKNIIFNHDLSLSCVCRKLLNDKTVDAMNFQQLVSSWTSGALRSPALQRGTLSPPHCMNVQTIKPSSAS